MHVIRVHEFGMEKDQNRRTSDEYLICFCWESYTTEQLNEIKKKNIATDIICKKRAASQQIHIL